ncbi:lipid-A-disaccharide synthase [Paraphotobacterium marinum]|uniref:Lipid-A-disaccharide synthase n=1 Tax=Paraphotobacterium marinum TaxID=1755811 RepID=A0A220VCB2_9GAMM|nr:lipid-A-disaccharide synthase [Paraphotobacterium marinum]ASK77812.1 lipid-A-disaccharide synthase [Paraphotobacterium marinum]
MALSDRRINVVIVAGELSGDILGANLIKAMKLIHPNISFKGIAGPKMMKEGCDTIVDIEKISKMGLIEVLPSLINIINIRKKIINLCKKEKPDLFIGIDAPSFNLGIEYNLKKIGIKTVHYAGPKVWAWKQWRIHKIKKSVDLMLLFLPFEQNIYNKFSIPSKLVGHELADQFQFDIDKTKSKSLLNLNPVKKTIAIVPGSRKSEIKYLTPIIIEACLKIRKKNADVQFIINFSSKERQREFFLILNNSKEKLDFITFQNRSKEVLSAADYAIVKSGTSTLECLLAKTPMVVIYKPHWATTFIVRLMLKIPFVSLPNLIAGKELVKELIADECTYNNIYEEIDHLMTSNNEALINQFTEIHKLLKKNASFESATAIFNLLDFNIKT